MNFFAIKYYILFKKSEKLKMMNGYQENAFQSQLLEKEENKDLQNSSLVNLTEKVQDIRKKYIFIPKIQKSLNFLNDFDPSCYREFEDPLDEIENKFMLFSNNEKKIIKHEDFFDIYAKDSKNKQIKSFGFTYKEEVKQKFLYNFITNDIGKATCFQVI